MRETYGKLTVIEVRRGSKDHHREAECICECGNRRRVRVTKLKRGIVTECAGCSMESARSAGRLIRRQLSDIERSVRQSFGWYRGNATRKQIPFELSLSDFRKLATSPCSYCGSAPEPTNGVDRANNLLGYALTNAVSCCSRCNFGKREMDAVEFIAWIRRVYQHQNAQ